MRTLILGAGSTGMQLARRLIGEGKDVALIERDQDRARIAANALDCLVVEGDGTQLETLKEAGAASCRDFVALTGVDEVNIVSCSVVGAEFAGTRRVARVRNPYFSQLPPERSSFMGVDRFVNPDIETAKAFLTLALQGADHNLVRFTDDELVLRTHRLDAASPFVGMSLRDSRLALKRDFLVASIERSQGVEIPSGETVPLEGDSITMIGSPRALGAVLGKAEAAAPSYRKVVIAGGGTIGRYVAEGFLGASGGRADRPSSPGGRTWARSRSIVMVDSSKDVCKRLSRALAGPLVINRDLSDEEIFLEEGLAKADLFFALTGNPELNILAAARAKEFQVRHALALTENNAYGAAAESLRVDSVVSLKTNVVSSIVEYLRGGALTTLHSFYERGLKILEFVVAKDSGMDGETIRDLELPKGALVIFVSRQGRMSLPTGETRFAVGDRIGIFTSMEAIADVERLFLGQGA